MSKLKQAMWRLSAQGIFAPDKKWKCCQTCGCAATPDNVPYAFFHLQDKERWDEEGFMHISFGDPNSDGSWVALAVRDAFRSVGLFAEWDGNVATRVMVSKEQK